MTEYTPTTETVRDRYALSIWPGVEGKDLRGAFDRWLEQVRAEVREQGAREERERISALETPASAANWSGAWDELLGYVSEAMRDDLGIRADSVWAYMNELKRRHVTDPVRHVLGIARQEADR